MVENTCKTCSYKYHDDFCMRNCLYVNDEHTCGLWTDKKIEFNYKVIHRLCKEYLEICDMYNEHERLKKKYPEELGLKNTDILDFSLKCCLNDLHREMSLWVTQR